MWYTYYFIVSVIVVITGLFVTAFGTPQKSSSSNEYKTFLKVVNNILGETAGKCSLTIVFENTTQIEKTLLMTLKNQHVQYYPPRIVLWSEDDWMKKESLIMEREKLSYRTLPPDIRFNDTLGLSCNFHVFLPSTDTMTYKRRLVHHWTTTRVDNMDDYFLFWVDDTIEDELFISPPFDGVYHMVAFTPNENESEFAIKQTCKYCNNGYHSVIKKNFNAEFDLGNLTLYTHQPSCDYHGAEITYTGIFEADVDIIKETISKTSIIFNSVPLHGLVVYLVSKELNFTWVFDLPEDGIYGRYSNGTWLGIPGKVLRKRLTMVPSGTMQEPDSYLFFATSLKGYPFRFTFATAIPKPVLNWQLLIKPFGVVCWILILITLIASAFTYSKITNISFRKSLSGFAKMTLGQSVDDETNNAKAKMLFIMLCFFSVIFSTAYTSIMFSMLAIPLKETVPENVEELLNSNYKWGGPFVLLVGLEDVMKFVKHKPTYEQLKIIFENYENTGDSRTCYERSLGENMACFHIDYYILREISEFMDSSGGFKLKIAKEAMVVRDVVPVIPRDDVCIHSIRNIYTYYLVEGGVLDFHYYNTIYVNFFEQFSKERKKKANRVQHEQYDEEAINTPLSLKTLFAPFTILVVGLFISSAIFCQEKVKNFKCKRI